MLIKLCTANKILCLDNLFTHLDINIIQIFNHFSPNQILLSGDTEPIQCCIQSLACGVRVSRSFSVHDSSRLGQIRRCTIDCNCLHWQVDPHRWHTPISEQKSTNRKKMQHIFIILSKKKSINLKKIQRIFIFLKKNKFAEIVAY